MSQISKWTIDFAQAKIALRNLETLVKLQSQCQLDVFEKLKALYGQYSTFSRRDNGEEEPTGAIAEQISLLQHIEHNIHMTTAKFSGKAAAQLDAARAQVNAIYHTLGKLRSLKPPQLTEVSDQLTQQIPEFLNLFDAFLARFTLEIRLQQADFLKELGSAFTHLGQPEPIRAIIEKWLTGYTQIMPAVEALKSVNPQPGLTPPGVATSGTDGKPNSRLQNEKVESVLFAPVKWVHSKVGNDLKEFKFSDPRKGFFDKPTQPPKHESETVRAIFDFKGETESDLMFKKGDIITLIDRGTEDDPNWWCGEFNEKRGLFPRNYVEELPAQEENYTDLPGQAEPSSTHPDEYVPKLEAPLDVPKSPSQESHTSRHSKGSLSTGGVSSTTEVASENPPPIPRAPHEIEPTTHNRADPEDAPPTPSRVPHQVESSSDSIKEPFASDISLEKPPESPVTPVKPKDEGDLTKKEEDTSKSPAASESHSAIETSGTSPTAGPSEVPIAKLTMKEDRASKEDDDELL